MIIATFLTLAEAIAFLDDLDSFAQIEKDIFSGKFNVISYE